MVLIFVQRPKEKILTQRLTVKRGKEASNTQATFWGRRRIALTANIRMVNPSLRLTTNFRLFSPNQ